MSQQALINPERLPGEPRLGPVCLLALLPPDLKMLRSTAGVEWRRLTVKELFKIYASAEEDLYLAGPALGAPQAVMVAEKLFALGAERLLVLGWAGALRREVRLGDLFLVSAAVSEEGTSAHYPLSARPGPDPALMAALRQSAGEEKDKLPEGPVWTTDAFYRETWEKVKDYARQGVLAVEMEMSALFTVAAFRKKALAGLMVISDELSEGAWRCSDGSPRFKAGRERAGRIVLRAARKMR